MTDKKLTDREIIKTYEGLTSNQQLNLFRNFYYNDGFSTENGIVANAINDILPNYYKQQAELEDLREIVFMDRTEEIKKKNKELKNKENRDGCYSGDNDEAEEAEMPETINVEKYISALDNLLGSDNAYYAGDPDVDAIMEVIMLAKKLDKRVKELTEEKE